MRYRIANMRHWLLGAAVVLSMTSTGCQSGWKMPSPSLFGWNKKPDPETIAGNSPSVYPTSPASKYTPSTLASSTPNASNSGSPATTAAGLNTTAGTLGSVPSAGTAAAANGYRVAGAPMTGAPATGAPTGGYATGPYSTNSAPPSASPYASTTPSTAGYATPTGATSPNPYPNNNYAVAAGASSSSPYGPAASAPTATGGLPTSNVPAGAYARTGSPVPSYGSPAGVTSGMPSSASSMTQGVPALQASHQMPSNGLPGMPPAGIPNTAMPNTAMPNMVGSNPSSMPTSYPGAASASLTGSSATYRMADTSPLPTTSGAPAAAYPAGQYAMPPGYVPPTGAFPGSTPTNNGMVSPSGVPAGSGAVPAGYRPGSTRESPYDFSRSANGSPNNAGANGSIPPMPSVGNVAPANPQAPSAFPSGLPTYNSGSVTR